MGLRVVRILRLSRIGRMERLLRSTPELYILVKGMVSAMRSVCSTMGLLFIMIYIYGILFTQLLADFKFKKAGIFETVPQSMNFLLLQVVCGFDPDFMTSL